MTKRSLCSLAALGLAALAGGAPAQDAGQLQPPSAFAGIQNREQRSAALFVEAGKVITSPRCLNCHPAVRVPTQGDDRHIHVPPVDADASGVGRPGLFCMTCHQARNVPATGTNFRSIPGHEQWHLAPAEMAWQGRSLREICEQVKDTTRNGGRKLQQISEHMGKDSLVGWAWHPGEGRKPAPGTQELFGQLIQAWIDTGAQCPR